MDATKSQSQNGHGLTNRNDKALNDNYDKQSEENELDPHSFYFKL